MAYGQTGSGKTFTMGTEGTPLSAEGGDANDASSPVDTNAPLQPPSSSDGVIPRAVFDLFDERQQLPQGHDRVTIELSYLEIYNEEARDLLAPENSTASLQIRDGRDGVVVQNLTTKVVTRPQEVMNWMKFAATKRATASTAMNAVSSRSHAICTLHVTIAPLLLLVEDETDAVEQSDSTTPLSTTELRAKLTLVDLAGSERIKRTGAVGTRMKEGININKGLFTLGQCVSALSELGQQGKSAATAGTHIPYRDSKLTRLLQDSLGGNSKTVMVACLSPADSNVEESVNTLRYASRTRNIQTAAVRNVAPATLSGAEAAALIQQNATLKLQLAQAQAIIQKQRQSNDSAQASNDTKHAKRSLTIVTSNLESETFPSMVGGVDVGTLDIVRRLQSTISSLESKLQSMEERQQSTCDDILAASMRSDAWQIKYEALAATAKDQGVILPSEASDATADASTDGSDSHLDLASQLRREVATLKGELHDALSDAAVARAMAAAVVAGNGDLSATAKDFALRNAVSSADDSSTTDLSSPSNDSFDGDESTDKEEQMAMTAELVSMSGGIESKEALLAQMNTEVECMVTMKSHFEKAVQSLQEEVATLESERSKLLAKTESTSIATAPSAVETKRMKARVVELESRMKELRQKAAEASKSLKLREAAEKKVASLAEDIAADKKKRVALQKQLREQQSERRSEKLEAKKAANRMLRDSETLRRELQKVKVAAAKQASVLRQKAEAALKRQKMEAAKAAKQRENTEERKRTAEARANARNKKQEPPTEHVSEDRNNQLLAWLDSEIESAIVLADLNLKIKAQKRLLENAKTTKMEMAIPTDSKSPSSLLASLDEEISMRSGIIEDLQQNVKSLIQANWTSPKAKATAETTSFMDGGLYDSFTTAEAKAVFAFSFHQLLKLKRAESTREATTSLAVSAALAKQRRVHEETVTQLKMEHSQALVELLGATQQSVEQNILSSLDSMVDSDVQNKVEEMLSGYLQGTSKACESVQGQLQDVQQSQAGMKQIAESVATKMVGSIQSGTPPKKKKSSKKKQDRGSLGGDSILEEVEMMEEDALDDVDNSDDSDWDPNKNKTPGRQRSKRRSADSAARQSQKKTVEFATASSKLDETMETVPEDMDEALRPIALNGNENDTTDYSKMKVTELREVLRARNLNVSGKKNELVLRLQDSDRVPSVVDLTESDGAHDENSKENALQTNRRASSRSNRGGLQSRDMNKIDLPATPPLSTKKGGTRSIKKMNSVRRSTMFSAKKRPPSPTSSPDSYIDSEPRNLGSVLASNSGNTIDSVSSVSNRALSQLNGNIA